MNSSALSFLLKPVVAAGLVILTSGCQPGDEPSLPAPESGFTKTFLLGYDARPYYYPGMNAHHLITSSDYSFLLLFNDLPPGRPEIENKIVLQKLSPSGETLLEKRLSFPLPTFGNGLLALQQGGYLIVGAQHSLGNYQESHLFLMRTDEEGQPVWSKTLPRSGEEVGLFAVEHPDGSLWILAKRFRDGKTLIIRTDELGNEYSRQDAVEGYSLADVTDMRPTADGGFVLAGDPILKLDIAGRLEWVFTLIPEYPELGISQRCTSITPNTAPGSAVAYMGLGHRAWNTGTSEEAEGYFLFSLYSDGRQGSFELLDLKDSDEPEMIIEAPPGMDSHGFLFSGVSQSEKDLRKSITIVRTDPTGKMLWNKELAIYGYEAESFLANPYGLAFLPFPEPTYAVSGSGFNGLGPGREVKLVIYRP